MKLHKIIKEINNSSLDADVVLKRRTFSIQQLKEYFLNHLIELTENTNAYLLTKPNTTFDIEINSLNNTWEYKISISKNLKKFTQIKNLILDYQFLGNQIKIWISNALYNSLNKIQVFVKTGIEDLQFERLKSEGINDYNTWRFEGPIYGNPSENSVIVKFLLNNGSRMIINLPIDYTLYYPFGTDYRVEVYKITNIPYLVETIYPSFSLVEDNFLHVKLYRKDRPKRSFGSKGKNR